MPYIGQTGNFIGQPGSHLGNLTVTGNIKSGGQLTANDTLFKMTMDTAANLGDNILIEDGGTDGSGTNAGDDICLEKDMQVVPAGDIISISGVAGAAAAAFEFVSSVLADDSADNVAFTNHESGYDYEYRWTNLVPGTSDQTWRAVLGTSGPSYLTSGYLGTSLSFNHSVGSYAPEIATYIPIGNQNYDGVEPDSGAGFMTVFDPAGSGVTKVIGHVIHRNAGHTYYNAWVNAYHTTAAVHTAIKFFFSSGNVGAGLIVQYRRKLSA